MVCDNMVATLNPSFLNHIYLFSFLFMPSNILFRQLFDEKTWTYSYLVGDTNTWSALIIDPVLGQVDRDLKLISELWLTLTHIFDTHIHADHITGSGVLRDRTWAKIAMGTGAAIAQPDILLADNEVIQVGSIDIRSFATPGHTDGCTSYLIEDMIFTGDTLLIRKTGRTDFQQWSPAKLYHSITKLYTLPDTTHVYPGHDYQGLTMSTIGEEKLYNTRMRSDTSIEELTETMHRLKLEYPKYIDIALPANMKLGIVSSDNTGMQW